MKTGADRTRRAGTIFLIAFVLTLLSIFVVFPLLTPAVSYPNIVSLEFAPFEGEDRAQKIIDLWRKDGQIEVARRNVWFDYLFIICYTAVMFLGCRWAASEFLADGYVKSGASGRFFFTPAQLIAGACDAVENVFMLLMLDRGTRGNSFAVFACAFATVKAILITAGFIFVLVASARALARATAR